MLAQQVQSHVQLYRHASDSTEDIPASESATHHVVRGPDGLQGFEAVKVARRECAQVARPQLVLHRFELPHHLGAPLAQDWVA